VSKPEARKSIEPVATPQPARREPATLLANSAFMLLARGFTLLAGGALAVYAVRTFSVAAYGRYAVAAAIVTIFALLSEMGISSYALRQMSHEDEPAGRTLGVALAAEVATSVVAIALLVPIALALGYSSDVILLLAIGSGVLLFQSLLPPLEAAFKARRVMVYAASFSVVQAAVTAAAGFAFVAAGAGPAGLFVALLLGPAVALPTALVLLRSKLSITPSFSGAWRGVLPLLAASIPIAFTGAITAIYERVDVLMVSKLDSSEAAAIYAVPLTVLQYALLVPAIIGTSFFPLLTTTFRADAPAARSLFFLVSRLFVFVSAPITILLIGSGDRIVTALFGARYHESGEVLMLLSWSVVLGFQVFLLWYGLLGAYRERGMVALMLAGLAFNVALNAILIPTYGVKGAAISLVLSDLLILAGQAVLLHRNVFAIPYAEILVRPLIAGAFAAPVLIGLRGVSGLLAGPAAAAVYIVVLLTTGYISRQEWEPLTTPLGTLVGRFRGRAAGAP
jgi:O-antigen/teichoic acid export membrane protein